MELVDIILAVALGLYCAGAILTMMLHVAEVYLSVREERTGISVRDSWRELGRVYKERKAMKLRLKEKKANG